MTLREKSEPRFHLCEIGWQAGERKQPASRIASLESMLTCRWQVEGREERIQLGDWTSTDQCYSAIEVLAQPSEGGHEFGGHHHFVRPLGNLKQTAVDVEEDGPVAAGRRRWGQMKRC